MQIPSMKKSISRRSRTGYRSTHIGRTASVDFVTLRVHTGTLVNWSLSRSGILSGDKTKLAEGGGNKFLNAGS